MVLSEEIIDLRLELILFIKLFLEKIKVCKVGVKLASCYFIGIIIENKLSCMGV